jgi:hypothetical protein
MDQLQDIKDRNENIMANISNLNNIQSDLKDQLENGQANNMSIEDQNAIIIKIQKIGKLQEDLYKNVSETYSFIENASDSMNQTLSTQSIARKIVTNETDKVFSNLQGIKEEKNNKLRLTEINYYYSEQYSDRTIMAKMFILICLALIILAFLKNGGFLFDWLYNILLIVILGVGSIYLFRQFLIAYNRDNMDYQEYNWNFNSSKAPKIDTSDPNGTNPWETPSLPKCAP